MVKRKGEIRDIGELFEVPLNPYPRDSRIEMKLPALPRLDHTFSNPVRERLWRTIREASSAVDIVVSCIGLELRVSHKVAIGSLDLRYLDSLLDSPLDGPRSPTYLFLRPAVEPVLLSFWEKFIKLDEVEWPSVGATLNPRAPLRDSYVATAKSCDGSFSVYPHTDEIVHWQNDLNDLLKSDMEPLSKAFIMYAVVIMCHPLIDGNGRLARAAMWASLARSGIAAPCLPLGPVAYANPSWLANSIRSLCATGDWSQYLKNMDGFILAAIEASIA